MHQSCHLFFTAKLVSCVLIPASVSTIYRQVHPSSTVAAFNRPCLISQHCLRIPAQPRFRPHLKYILRKSSDPNTSHETTLKSPKKNPAGISPNKLRHLWRWLYSPPLYFTPHSFLAPLASNLLDRGPKI
ncbi:hypothetical protein BJX64DRAFT_115470 [Aspergillus heterothallicus]